jgi:chloride channel protein, CIC family
MSLTARFNLKNFIKYVYHKISRKNLLVILSGVIGLAAALLAIILKTIVHYIEDLLKYNSGSKYENYYFFLYPLIGILFTVLYIQVFRGGVLVKGLSSLILTFYRKTGNLAPHKMYSHLITSAVTVAFGGSVGLEAPIVITGAATGSNIAMAFKLNPHEKVLMLACGASAGIAAIFNCPIAAVIFSFEVLLGDVKVPAFVPLIISSVTATLVSQMIYSGQLFVLVTKGWDINAIPYYILLGVCCGLISAYMITINTHIERIFKLSKSIYKKVIVGGLILGALIFIFPPLFGEGYKSVSQLLKGNYSVLLENSLFYGLQNQWFILFYIALIIFLKIMASAVTIGSGGNGGIFAPSLFTGALTGFFVSHFFNLAGLSTLNEINFVAVGMAGVLSGVVHAPLTGIFLIAEITGGYVLFVPLMIVSATSFFISKYFEPYSVYTKELAKSGKWSAYDKDAFILTQIKLNSLVERDFVMVNPNDTLGQLIHAVAKSKRNIFPVVDSKGVLEGIIFLDDIRELIFKQELYKQVTVKEIMKAPPAVIEVNESMQSVMQKFEYFEAWNLPVEKDKKYLGFISKSKIFNVYRNLLVEHSREVF